jgi:hypothetical protein
MAPISNRGPFLRRLRLIEILGFKRCLIPNFETRSVYEPRPKGPGFGDLMKSEDKFQRPLVTCKLEGQLGNQLFTIAATLSYAWEYGATPIFPLLHTEKYRLSYNRDRIFFRLDSRIGPRPFVNYYEEVNWFTYNKIHFKPDLVVDGYFQSWRYFHNYRDQILSEFAPSDSILSDLQTKYKEILESPNTVSVHVRTSSRKVHPVIPFLGLDYIENTMNLFPSDSFFVVFSDRINWAKNKLANRKTNIVFIEGNDAVQDLFLMSKCKHNIIANSTFSWWAAYMNQNPNKRVICANYWGAYPRIEVFDDLYLPEWERQEVRLAPYPEDMKAFDVVSQSMDNND